MDTVSTGQCQSSIHDIKKDCLVEDFTVANNDKICEQYNKNQKMSRTI